MKNLKNNLKIIIPALLMRGCLMWGNPSSDELEKLKKYNQENNSLYKNFKELIEERIHLSSKDKKYSAWIEENSVEVTRKYSWGHETRFIDINIDGLDKNELDPLLPIGEDAYLSLAKNYTEAIKKIMSDNEIK